MSWPVCGWDLDIRCESEGFVTLDVVSILVLEAQMVTAI